MKAREAAFRIVHEVVYKKGYSNIALEQILRKGNFDGKDAGFITEIALGTLRNKLFLDHVISNYSNIKIKKISPSAMSALLIGSYQIIFMDRTPDSAACNESVRIASKFAGSRTRGFVNAVMRAITRDKKPIGGYLGGLEGIDYLSIRYSCSLDAVSKIIEQYGFETTEKILKGM
ncbi:MAG: transcription antitermination factor NusB, partial [Clostridia bacterium]|nr:transcription antitermination factor NusB [Clostridia bacterium]